MSSFITQVKSKLFIASSRASSNALDGDYPSMMRGRSLDFEDLHRYENGDDIRDIDWRATARLGIPLVKRSRAQRAQTVLFAVDTGRGMAAIAPDGSPKRDLSVLATGLLAYLSLRHGDQYGIIYGDAAGVERTEVRRSMGSLEIGLRRIHTASSPHAAASSRERLLDSIVRTVSRRSILVVVTDAAPFTSETERLIRRLQVQHDMLWITIADADPLETQKATRQRGPRQDVNSKWLVPSFLQGDAELRAELAAADRANTDAQRAILTRLSIMHTELRSVDDAAPKLLRLLDRRANVRA